MATVKLYDPRDPLHVGREAFNALDRDEDIEIQLDRDSLAHAFFCACENMGPTWESLADRVSATLSGSDCVSGKDAIEARQEAVHALEVVYTLMGLIWETTPGIRDAEERFDEIGRGRTPSKARQVECLMAALKLRPASQRVDAELDDEEAPGPYDAFPDDDDDDPELALA